MKTLDDLFCDACNRPSDINEHCLLLYSLALSHPHVVEFGVRGGVSTTALLAGQPETLTCVDINECLTTSPLWDLKGRTSLTFIQGNTRTIEPMLCDLLFIDTLHTAEQLAIELERHSPFVRRTIVLHDTETFGEHGEGGGDGLLKALLPWLTSSSQWKMGLQLKNNNGLTVLQRSLL